MVKEQRQYPSVVILEHPGLAKEGVAEGLPHDGHRNIIQAVLVVPGIQNPGGGRGEGSLFVRQVHAKTQGTDWAPSDLCNADKLHREQPQSFACLEKPNNMLGRVNI